MLTTKNFMNGFYIGGPYMDFAGTKNKELWGRFIGDVGNRWLIGKPESEQTEIYRKNGVKIITPELYYIANGYRLVPGEVVATARDQHRPRALALAGDLAQL